MKDSLKNYTTLKKAPLMTFSYSLNPCTCWLSSFSMILFFSIINFNLNPQCSCITLFMAAPSLQVVPPNFHCLVTSLS